MCLFLKPTHLKIPMAGMDFTVEVKTALYNIKKPTSIAMKLINLKLYVNDLTIPSFL